MTPARTIGASDVPVVLGISPFKESSAYALWARLMGYPLPASPDNAAMARGRMIEPGILLRIREEVGGTVWPNTNRWYPIDDWPYRTSDPASAEWAHATPDGIHFQDGSADWHALCEAKTARLLEGWGEDGTDQVRTDYVAQVAWQLYCTKMDLAYVGAFGTRFDDWRMYEVPRNKELQKALVAKVLGWWERYVEGATMPELDGTQTTARALAAVYKHVTGERVEATPSDKQIVRQILAIDEHLEEVHGKRGKLRNRLRDSMGRQNATYLVDHDEVLARWTQDKNGNRSLTVIRERE